MTRNLKKRLGTAAATLTIAFAAGHIMQNGLTLPGGLMANSGPEVLASIVEEITLISAPASSEIEEVTRAENRPVFLAPILPESASLERDPPLQLAAASEEASLPPQSLLETPTPAPIPRPAACETGFTAMAARAAMVELTIEAPCYGGQKIEILHAGMKFTEVADENGIIQTMVPAMEEDARFTASFADGHTESVNILMLTLDGYERIALTWQGETGFELHAFENGATYGSGGHIWAGNPGATDRAILGEGGFMTMLGQGADGYTTAVYSYPAHLADTQPAPEVSIEAEVMESTCGHQIAATFMRMDAARAPISSGVTMAVPDCHALGEFLVLKNLPRDMRIARN